MEPALPDRPSEDGPFRSADPGDEVGEVGEFAQGSEFSRWALARYIVGRVILERVSWSLLAIAVTLLVIGALFEWLLHTTFLAILAALVALLVLALRVALRAVLRRLMGAQHYGPLEDRLHAVAKGASSDVMRELRRVGLPSRLITLPLIGMRLLGRRRKVTVAKMRQFEMERAVPAARLDELHMVLREAAGRPRGGPQAPGTMST